MFAGHLLHLSFIGIVYQYKKVMKLISFDHNSINQFCPSLCVAGSPCVFGFHRLPCTAGGSPRKSAVRVQGLP